MPFDTTPYIERFFSQVNWNCWILVATVLNREFGLNVPTGKLDWPRVGDREAIQATFTNEQRAYTKIEDRTGFLANGTHYQPGDIVQLRIYRETCHVGVIHERRSMLHVMANIQTCLVNLDGIEWRPRVQGVYRHPAMEES